jgi:hypothetical protein
LAVIAQGRAGIEEEIYTGMSWRAVNSKTRGSVQKSEIELVCIAEASSLPSLSDQRNGFKISR